MVADIVFMVLKKIKKVMSHPLMCWDIVSEGNARRFDFEMDLEKMRNIKKLNKWELNMKRNIEDSIIWENKTLLVTNAKLDIVWATKNIFEMNGYQPKEVIGKHPKMFQGAETSLSSRKMIRLAVEESSSFECNITNYKKDGSLYTCHIEAYPVFNQSGELINFLAFENAA